jgi:hypothetical protein
MVVAQIVIQETTGRGNMGIPALPQTPIVADVMVIPALAEKAAAINFG